MQKNFTLSVLNIIQPMIKTQAEINQNEKELLSMMKELTTEDEQVQKDLAKFIQMLAGEVK